MLQLSHGGLFLIFYDDRWSLVCLCPETPFRWCLVQVVKPDMLLDLPVDEVLQVLVPLLRHGEAGEHGFRGEDGQGEQEEDGASHGGQDGMEVH